MSISRIGKVSLTLFPLLVAGVGAIFISEIWVQIVLFILSFSFTAINTYNKVYRANIIYVPAVIVFNKSIKRIFGILLYFLAIAPGVINIIYNPQQDLLRDILFKGTICNFCGATILLLMVDYIPTLVDEKKYNSIAVMEYGEDISSILSVLVPIGVYYFTTTREGFTVESIINYAFLIIIFLGCALLFTEILSLFKAMGHGQDPIPTIPYKVVLAAFIFLNIYALSGYILVNVGYNKMMNVIVAFAILIIICVSVGILIVKFRVHYSTVKLFGLALLWALSIFIAVSSKQQQALKLVDWVAPAIVLIGAFVCLFLVLVRTDRT